MEKKNFNVKGFLIMLGIVMAISLVPTVIQVIVQYAKEVEFGTSGFFKEEDVKELSEEVIDLFTAKSYKEVITDYAIADANTEETIQSVKDAAIAIGEDWGEYQETTFKSLSELKKWKKYYASVQAEVVYENVTVIFDFVFDEDMKLAGLNLQNGAPVEEESESN